MKKENNDKPVNLVITLPKKEHERLQKLADKYGISIKSWCNIAIIRSLDDEEKRNKTE